MTQVITEMTQPQPIKFTRYLYDVTYVKIAITFSLLDKKEDEAWFWAYELYISGFKEELIEFLWITYFQFYASLNFYLEQYFIKKRKEYGEEINFIKCMIANLLIKPYTLDVFLMKEPISDLEIAIEEKYKDIYKEAINLHREKKYDEVMNKLEIGFKEELQSGKISIKYFKNLNKPEIAANPEYISLSRIYMCLSLKTRKAGKKVYMSIDDLHDETYDSYLEKKESLPRLYLSHLDKSIQRNKYTSLFKVEFEGKGVEDAYLHKWEYYAYKSPIWKKRFDEYKIHIDNEEASLKFEDDDEFEKFYDVYGYEPDEQAKKINEYRFLRENTEITVNEFVKEYNKYGFVTDRIND
jgi:hypothetical protein